jgi:hypothetical protein
MANARTTDAIESLLYRAAARATLAPSIYNTQPWRFVVHPDGLDVLTDPKRAVAVIDPCGRQRVLSCGAALFGARISLAAAGFGVEEARVASLESDPDLLLSLILNDTPAYSVADARRLDAAADRRRSNRRRFTAATVPSAFMETLHQHVAAEGAELHPIVDLDDRVVLATLVQRADALQNSDPAYRAELRSWTTDDPSRHDGVSAASIPHVTGLAHSDVPIRDFDTFGAGELPADPQSGLYQTFAVITTRGDERRDWLTAGQALYRLLLELTDAGYVASVLSQVCEVASARVALRDNLRLFGNPQIVVRAGLAASTLPTLRRPLVDVISTRTELAGHRTRP